MLENNNTLFMGIDGGGTKCRVRIESSSGQLLGTGLGGAANPSQGLAVVVDSITQATHMALAEANLPQDCMNEIVVGAGLAGLHLPQYHQVMSAWQHPFAELFLTNDLETALLGAHQGKEGAVIIVGTGFSAMSIVNGKRLAIGGYGFLMADYCSGSWIGHQAVQAALLDIDNLSDPTLLTAMLENKFSGRGCELANKLVGATPKDFGDIAPLVFFAAEKQDLVALRIIKQSRDFIVRVINQLDKERPERISLVGSIAKKLQPSLSQNVLNKLLEPAQSPEQGAIHFARSQYQLVNESKMEQFSI